MGKVTSVEPSGSGETSGQERFSLVVVLLRAIVWTLARVPRSWSQAFCNALGLFYGSVIRFRRVDALDALQQAFPERRLSELKAIRKKMYRHLAHTLGDSLRMASMSADDMRAEVTWIDRHHLDEAWQRGKGVIAATGHLGDWEMMAASGQLFGYPQTVVVKAVKPASMNRYLTGIRGRFGTEVLMRDGSYRRCITALKREKKLLGFIIDQNTTRSKGVFVDFFGRPACSTPGAAFLSAQAGAPIVPIFSVRQADGSQQLHCLPLIEPPPNREPDSILAVTQSTTKALESMIRRYPEQWTWVHRRWRTQPEKNA